MLRSAELTVNIQTEHLIGGDNSIFDHPDDPLVNMDAERTARACSLIRDCAERHQILFLTYREEYADLLEGNRITLA